MKVGVLTARRALLVAALCLLLPACGKDHSAPAQATASRGTTERPWLIGVSQCNLGEPWRAQMNEDIAAVARQHPNLRLILTDAQNDSLRQRAQVGELVAQKIDLLIISPKETAPLTKPVAEAFGAGIGVIGLDRRVAGDRYTTFIGAGNARIGHAAGKWIARALGGKSLPRETVLATRLFTRANIDAGGEAVP